MEEHWGRAGPAPPPKAKFKKVYKEIPKREDYRGCFEDSWWRKFSKFDLPEAHHSWIDKEKMKKEAKEVGYESVKLDKMMNWLENGVDIGVTKMEARMETDRGANMESAYDYGEEFTDTLQSWVKDEIVAGPFTREELRRKGFKKLKIIPVQVVPKPNGKLRIILDLSSPHLKKNQMKPGVACSVNAGIVKEDYPATMATTRTVLRRLYEVGSGVHFSKIDWKAAYKHFGVR